ncbi:MAG: tripartite tricarboxylate transporter TctB family protein [Sphingomicrobium sp.]
MTGLLFLALGGFAIIYGARYAFGSAARMGPGFYPLVVSSGLVLLGIILVVRSFLRPGEAIETINWRPLFFVLLGTLAFALLVERAGFVLAAVLLIFAARLADGGFRWLEVMVLAAALVAFVAALFWLGLSLPLRPFPF